jgi:molybdopterin-binding protein
MPISARNQLEAEVVEVNLGDIMAHVVVRIGQSQVESVITRRSAEELALKKGDKVTAVIKSTEVMLQKDFRRSRSAKASEHYDRHMPAGEKPSSMYQCYFLS